MSITSSFHQVRVRFAPSPTGFLHIGGLRTALYNYLFARKHRGSFILRIEDTDQKRFIAKSEAYILEALNWLGLKIDEGPNQGGMYGPYRQSERNVLYRKAAKKLVAQGDAYYAFDSEEEIEAMRAHMKAAGILSPKYNALTRTEMRNSLTLPQQEVERLLAIKTPFVVRFKVNPERSLRFYDEVHGWIQVATKTLDDKVLLKSDGGATYHLANVIDDHAMEISHVIRGEEWLPSTPLHLLLYEAFHYTPPTWVHLPLILRADGKGKLSKRSNDLSMPLFPLSWKNNEQVVTPGFREMGYLPAAVINFLALLGWHPSGNRELFSLEALEQHFNLQQITKSAARFNFEKAIWFNQQYVQQLSNDFFIKEIILPHLQEKKIAVPTTSYMKRSIDLIKPRLLFLKDFWEQADFFYYSPSHYDDNKWKEIDTNKYRDFLEQLLKDWNSLPAFDPQSIKKCIKEHCKNVSLKHSILFPLIRIAISGRTAGPDLMESLSLLGRQESVKRLTDALSLFSS